MCFGVISGALAAKYIGDKKAEKAQNAAYASERTRQQGLTDEQQTSFEDSMARSAEMADPNAQAKAASSREAVLAQALTPAATQASASYMPGSASAPSLVGASRDKAAESTHAYSANLAHALAAMGGAGDLQLQTDIGVGRNSQQIGQIGGFKRGSAAMLPAELQAAGRKGAFLRGLGDFMLEAGKTAAQAYGGGV